MGFMSEARHPTAQHLLIPFAGRSSPGCQAALPNLRLPHLEKLLARLTLARDDSQPIERYSPPHERALAEVMGIAAQDGCIPWAALEARENGLDATGPNDIWALLTLCHWEVAIDEVLLDPVGETEGIAIDAAESAAILAAARALFEEDGIALHESGLPGRWLARGAVFAGLATASIDRVAGQPISNWLPQTDATRPLRKLQNEMQMLLYTERVNDARTERGAPAINSFWVSGTGALPLAADSQMAATRVLPDVAAALRLPALRDDGSAWASAWHAIDAGPCAELLELATHGTPVVLTLCGDRSARRYTLQPRGIASRIRSRFGRQSIASVLSQL